MAVSEAAGDTTRRPSRPRRLVALIVVVALVAAAAVAVALLRGRREPFAGGRTSMTGGELITSLGNAVAEARTGRVRISVTDESTQGQTVDFRLGGADVDCVVDDEQGRAVVIRDGVVAVRDVGETVSLAELRSRKAPLELEGIPLALAESLKVMTFQGDGDPLQEHIPADSLFTRVSASGDGTSVWTGSWASRETSLRRDARVVVDAAGLPVELRLVQTKEAESTRPSTVTVYTYSRWAQAVEIPEPTPFGKAGTELPPEAPVTVSPDASGAPQASVSPTSP